MHQRILYGLIAGATIICVAMLDAAVAERWQGQADWGPIVGRGTIIPAFLLLMVLGGAVELNRLMRSAGLSPHAVILHVMVPVMLLSPWLCSTGLLGASITDVEGWRWQAIWTAVLVLWTAVAQLARGARPGALADIGATWMGVLYLGLMTSFALRLRCDRDIPAAHGAWLFLVFLLLTKIADVGGYLVGSAFGRHKLIPSISPGKSIEGTLGGISASVVVAILVCRFPVAYQVFYPSLRPDVPAVEGVRMVIDEVAPILGSLTFSQTVLFGFFMSFIGLVGDLFESTVKRSAGLKDSASLIPTYGGVLDLIDSPVLAGPVAWFLLTVWWDVV